MRRHYLWLICLVLISEHCFARSTHGNVAKAKKAQPVQEEELLTPMVQEELQTPSAIALQKPLDLTLPFKTENDTTPAAMSPLQKEPTSPSLFTPENKPKTRSVQLDGRLLMTQDQEVEKRKTLDGAGIVINVQR